MKTVLYHSIIC